MNRQCDRVRSQMSEQTVIVRVRSQMSEQIV